MLDSDLHTLSNLIWVCKKGLLGVRTHFIKYGNKVHFKLRRRPFFVVFNQIWRLNPFKNVVNTFFWSSPFFFWTGPNEFSSRIFRPWPKLVEYPCSTHTINHWTIRHVSPTSQTIKSTKGEFSFPLFLLGYWCKIIADFVVSGSMLEHSAQNTCFNIAML